MTVTKDYMEWYALLSLIYCYDNNLSALLDCKNEEPDWQSIELGIGIEVTEAMGNEDGRKRAVINRYFGKELDGKAIKSEIDTNYPEYSQQFGVEEGRAYFFEFHDTELTIQHILHTILIKTEKLNDHYRHFANNWLYVYLPQSLENSDILKIYQDYQATACQGLLKFDKIFFNMYDKILVLNQKKIECSVPISNEYLEEMKRQAQEKAQLSSPRRLK